MDKPAIFLPMTNRPIPFVCANRSWMMALIFLFWALAQMPAALAAGITALAATPPTLQTIDTARQAVDHASALTEPERVAALKLYDQASLDLQAHAAALSQTQELDQRLQQATQRLYALSQTASISPISQTSSAIENLNLEQLERELTELEHQRILNRQSQQSAQTRLSRVLGSTQNLNAQLVSRQTSLRKIDNHLQQLPEVSGNLLIAAQRDALLAQQMRYQAEIAYQKKVLDNQAQLQQLAQAERDHFSLATIALQSDIQTLNQLIQTHREHQAVQIHQSADELKQLSIKLPHDFQQLALKNKTLTAEFAQLVDAERHLKTDVDVTNQQLLDIQTDFERTRQRVQIVGHNAAINQTLRSRQAELPTLASLQRERAARDTEIADATHRQLEIDDALHALAHEEARYLEALQQANQHLPLSEQQRLTQAAQDVIAAYRTTLLNLQTHWSRYTNQLVALDMAQENLDRVTHEYSSYIDHQLFWMPSIGALNLFSSLSDPANSAWQPWLTEPLAWKAIREQLRAYSTQHPLALAAAVILLLLLQFRHTRLGQYLQQWSVDVRQIQTDSIRWTLRAIAAQLLRVLPLPGLLFGLSYILGLSANLIAQAYAQGLHHAALLILLLGMLKEFARPDGVGASHFGWPSAICQAIVSELRWFIPTAAVLAFFVAAYAYASPPDTVQAAGSMSFLLLMLAWIHLTVRLFGTRSDLRRELQQTFTKSWANQFHFIWYCLLLALPFGLALLSLLGYHYTAIELETRVQSTIWYWLMLYLLLELVLRWLYLATHRLKQTHHERHQHALKKTHSHASGGETHDRLITPQLPEINYESLSEQSKRLVHTGFLFAVIFGTASIWHNLLPTLGLWQASGLPLHEATAAAIGLTSFMPVTVIDILIGLFILMLTVLAARNMPGLLEITLLQRLPLDHGLRYAITALIQYSIAGVGLFMALNTMGLPWDKLQWLIAALGVGLGFGLQEIVANFVSGIILLFERPIRVGDVVTVDGTTGVVTRIQIRATTITNFDRQELLVPNKEFITNRLINWTLTDKINRIRLAVGVGYDTDVDLAMKLMHEAATEQTGVLTDPPPLVSFELFGQDALMLHLRAYLGDLDHRLEIQTGLHRAILQKFKDAGIEIPFAQHDVHLSVQNPLDVHVSKTLEN